MNRASFTPPSCGCRIGVAKWRHFSLRLPGNTDTGIRSYPRVSLRAGGVAGMANPTLKNAGLATRFRPGHPDNPSGRSKESAEVKELARKDAAEAWERLPHWMRGNNPG